MILFRSGPRTFSHCVRHKLKLVLVAFVVLSTTTANTNSLIRHVHASLLRHYNRTSAVTTESSPTKQQGIHPPIVKRDEDRMCIAGVLPNDHPLKSKLIRQSESSTLPLLDPPRYIPDPYGWLRDDTRTAQEVLDHLHAENRYTENRTAHLDSLRDELYGEMLGYIQETDYSTPANWANKYYYYTRTIEGEGYGLYCRAPVSSNNKTYPKIEWDGTKDMPILPGEEVYLNVNDLARNQSYCSVSSTAMPKSQSLLAYTVDFTGNEMYSLVVKNLETNETIFDDTSLKCDGQVIWGGDENTVFYMKVDETRRPFQVYRKYLDGSPEDELIFEQLDELYWTTISKSSDERYVFISTSSAITSEVYYLDLMKGGDLKCIAKQRRKVLYDVDHWKGHWIITSNVNGTPNMQFVTCKVGADESQWKAATTIHPETGEEERLFDGGYEKSLDRIVAFEEFLVAKGRLGGIPRVWVMKLDLESSEVRILNSIEVTFDEDAYDIRIGANYNYNTDRLVLSYESMTTPLQLLEVSMKDPSNIESRNMLRAQNVTGYNKADYNSERFTVLSRDGKTKIPVTIVYRHDTMEKHSNSGGKKTLPVHLYGYGSYGTSIEARFSTTRLSLLNRGMVYAVAHVRGGGEMGRQWYEEPDGGKYLCKENTFNDFVDVAKWFTEQKNVTTPKQLSIEGRSAGGLLIGASINEAPELFGVAILGVPFLDLICTMVDSSLPLTTVEWEEWGNPNEDKYFDYMMGYSPMNNVKMGRIYPSCLLTGGLHDGRVQFWEPAKFAAELRYKQDTDTARPVYLKIDMTAGHFTASDRYKSLKELAFDYAFLLDQLGLLGVEPLS